MTKNWLIALALCSAAAAQAQDSGFSVHAGARAWYTQWDTFSYYDAGGGTFVVIQAPGESKFVLLPVLSVRYGDFVGSASMYPSTDHQFVDDSVRTRKEFDLNVGYYVAPAVALTLGYKRIEQKDPRNTYEFAGPVAGVSATAPLGANFALYGTFSLGRMKSTSASNVKFDAGYRLGEAGIAYTLTTPSVAKALTYTAGYRTQVITSKEAAEGQDGRDLTQGLTLGVIASF